MPPLTLAEIQGLLDEEVEKTLDYARTQNIQNGPLRWYDTEMRCVSRGCSSPTHCKVEGLPLCMMHSLRKLNELCIEMAENWVKPALDRTELIQKLGPFDPGDYPDL
jgi:hypothetical protein